MYYEREYCERDGLWILANPIKKLQKQKSAVAVLSTRFPQSSCIRFVAIADYIIASALYTLDDNHKTTLTN